MEGTDNKPWRLRSTLLRRRRSVRRASVAALMGATAVATAAFLAWGSPAQAAPPPPDYGWTHVVTGGFNDPGNMQLAWTTEFKGHFYLSTQTPAEHGKWSGSEKQGGDIWRTADGISWEQVGTPGLGNPGNIMFSLLVFRDQLYAFSVNPRDPGMEIWVTSDGTQFTKVEASGLHDPNSTSAVPFILEDRLILAVSNSETGVQIWASDEGRSFRQVVSGGLGVEGTTGAASPGGHPTHPTPFLDGKLYLGIHNSTNGGEIWRTADGLDWERAADKGLGTADRSNLFPQLVYQDQVYAFGFTTAGTLEQLAGFDLFRSKDGTNWEQVVEDGFGVGKERNIAGQLTEFKGRLYLTTQNMDPRVPVPGNPIERVPPKGFQLYVSDDGADWDQVGQDGFGINSNWFGGTNVLGDTAYLTADNYHTGSELWTSLDGQNWDRIFKQPKYSMFNVGGRWADFQGHLLWISGDRERGIDIWRSDEQLVAVTGGEEATGPDESGTTSSTTAQTETSMAAGGSSGTSGSSGGAGPGGAGEDTTATGTGLSGGWWALIIALAVVAVGALTGLAFVLGRGRSSQAAAAVVPAAPPVAAPVVAPPGEAAAATDSAPAFCAGCGTALSPESQFCRTCGRPV